MNIDREDMLELTRRMTPARSSVARIAGAYMDEEGYVDLPNINLVEEMVGMISASKAYEANATVAENVKTMMQTAMNI